MIRANDPRRRSFVPVAEDSDFPIQNLPLGVAEIDGSPEVVSIIGDQIIRLAILVNEGHFSNIGVTEDHLNQPSINKLISLGKEAMRSFRNELSDLMLEDSKVASEATRFLLSQKEVSLILPVEIGDYTDFYSSREHATNVGSMFRDPENALLPNWLHLPVGYHGRSSSIVVSGTSIHRPKGQQRPDPDKPPVFGPCKLLDFELEMAFVIGGNTRLGQTISTSEAENYIFGVTLFNDWSARDIQKWEYVPLGPFLAKSFASTISPWIVSLDALEPFRVQGPKQVPEVLPYLQQQGKKNYDIDLQVDLHSAKGGTAILCQSNFKYMYWSMVQQLAHHTINGCNVKVGDMCASGTISGKEASSFGSMLEITWRGTKPATLSNGEERKFIADGDSIRMTGSGRGEGYRIGFGLCEGTILPATSY